ncbi:MAG TPA: MFS transporter [Gammaproteobacteria bacterium]|nr:MFS transporter [Gammaproteobacteria bacterium]
MPNDAFRKSLQLLRTRRFGTFWIASLLSNIGTWAQQVAEPWLLLSLGASSFLIGLDSFAMSAPVFLLTLVGGVLADRADRRRVIASFQSIQMLCPTLIVVLLLAGTIQPWVIIVLSLVVGVTDALSMPSFQSIVPSIVEREQIPAGIALNSTQFNLSRILGPAVAGVLMASVGAVGAFTVSAASYLPFIMVALWILPHRGIALSDGGGFVRSQLFAGVREIAREPSLRGALLTVLVTSTLCAPLITFCPVIVKDAFHGDIGHFSITIGAFGAGGLLGAIGLLAVDPKRDRRPLSSWSAAGYGAILVFAALNPWSWGLPAVFVFAGMSMTASNASANALLQATAPARIRGQTVSLFMLAMRGGVSLGSLLTGVSVSLIGVREALLINGVLAVMAIIAVGRAWLRSPLPVSPA